METKQKRNTRGRILAAARELFMKYGVDRVSMRDIAAHAHINLSLTNYYFITKENLLMQILADGIRRVATNQRTILDSESPIEEKIREYIDCYIDALVKDPLLVSFVLSTLHRYAEKAVELESVGLLYSSDKFAQQVRQAADMGIIKPTDPEQLYVNMLSLILFPFSIKGLVQHKTNSTDNEMQAFMDARRDIIYDTIMASLKY